MPSCEIATILIAVSRFTGFVLSVSVYAQCGRSVYWSGDKILETYKIKGFDY